MESLGFDAKDCLLRPCFVVKVAGTRLRTRKGACGDVKEEKVKALFHRWYEYKNIVEGSIMTGGHPAGQVSWLYGVVEFEDGKVGLVEPQNIIFVGTEKKMKEYSFGDEQGWD